MKKDARKKQHASELRKSNGEMIKVLTALDIVLLETVRKPSICALTTFLVEIGSIFAMVVHLKRFV